MATIIYHDIEKSKYTFNYEHLTFYFSAPLYLNKFKDKYIEYIKSETDKFNSRFHMNIYADELFLLELYRKIEKRLNDKIHSAFYYIMIAEQLQNAIIY